MSFTLVINPPPPADDDIVDDPTRSLSYATADMHHVRYLLGRVGAVADKPGQPGIPLQKLDFGNGTVTAAECRQALDAVERYRQRHHRLPWRDPDHPHASFNPWPELVTFLRSAAGKQGFTV